jgi:hypothetical protein
MANEEHLVWLKQLMAPENRWLPEKLQQGVATWNQWRRENPDIQPDLKEIHLIGLSLNGMDFHSVDLAGANLMAAHLQGATLAGARLTRARLEGTNLAGADLFKAALTRVDLAKATLTGANLTGVRLINANLTSADLTSANLTEADLRGANLYGALLNHANLENALLGGTIFANVNLGSTYGLSSCKHDGPSALDYVTLSKSLGIPQTFLLGTGLPQAFVDFLPSLMERPFEFYSCFISYTTKDEDFARRLYTDLQELGIRSWFAPQELRVGERIQDQLDAAIRAHDKLILVLSRESMKSQWIQYEVEKALNIERETQRTVLFPLKLDDLIFQISEPWVEALKQRLILDFSSWRNEQLYISSLSRLAKALTLTAASEMPEAR